MLNNTPFANNYTICFTSLTKSPSDVIATFPFVTIKRYVIFYVLTESDLFYLLPHDTPRFFREQWENSAFFDSDYAFSDYSCVRQISEHLPMHYVMANHIGDQLNDDLRQLFIELVASIEKIIRDLYWVPAEQRQHLLTELTGLSLQLQWDGTYDTFNGSIHEISENYFSNMLVMIRYKARQYLRGNPYRTITNHHDSSFHLINKMIGM